jgi:hypothetical protein
MQQILQIYPPLSFGWLLFVSRFLWLHNHQQLVRHCSEVLVWLIVVFWGKFILGLLRTGSHFRAILSCLVALPSPRTVDCYIPQSIPALSISHLIDSKGSGANCFTGPPSRAHLVLKRSPNPPSPHLCAAAEAVSSAPRQNWRPRGQRRRGKASAMVLGGYGGHSPMIWRPSDMVSMVDRWWMGVLCVKKYGTFVRTSQKNEGPHQPPTLPQRRNL